MIGKTDKSPQLHMYQVPLVQFIDKEHELCQLAEKINWDELEKDLSVYYCPDNGRPSIPIRKITGVILLKRMFKDSDECVVDRWKENPYWQYFCGEVHFQHLRTLINLMIKPFWISHKISCICMSKYKRLNYLYVLNWLNLIST
jgi:hypothetical protein